MKYGLEAAKSFQRWVTSEVLPSIRKYGYYINPGAEVSKTDLRKMEPMMRESLRQYIYPEDVRKYHQKLRMSESYVCSVLEGNITNNVVMNDLQVLAITVTVQKLTAISIPTKEHRCVGNGSHSAHRCGV